MAGRAAVVRAVVLALAVLLLPGLGPAGRGGDDEAWRHDPYTDGDPRALAAAGYVSLGPMAWGDDHGSREIEELLGTVELRFVETAHFRIGSSLPELRLGRSDRKPVRAELERLAERLPGVDVRTRTLDPWLRVHLFAQRLEDLYADLQTRLRVTDADFPAAGETAPTGEPSMGEGPYLGQPGKYAVLLLEKRSGLGRYGRRYGGTDADAPLRLGFPRSGVLCFVTCSEFFEGDFACDTALRCHVVWNVVQILLDGYKGYHHVLPRWWREGLAHWYVRRIEPRFGCFSQLREPMAEAVEQWDWEPKVRARVGFGVYPRAEELLTWSAASPLSLADNAMMWSRVDYLMSLEGDGFARFMSRLSDPIPAPAGQVPGPEAVAARQSEALRLAWDLDAESFDARWSAWVLDTYRKR